MITNLNFSAMLARQCTHRYSSTSCSALTYECMHCATRELVCNKHRLYHLDRHVMDAMPLYERLANAAYWFRTVEEDDALSMHQPWVIATPTAAEEEYFYPHRRSSRDEEPAFAVPDDLFSPPSPSLGMDTDDGNTAITFICSGQAKISMNSCRFPPPPMPPHLSQIVLGHQSVVEIKASPYILSMHHTIPHASIIISSDTTPALCNCPTFCTSAAGGGLTMPNRVFGPSIGTQQHGGPPDLKTAIEALGASLAECDAAYRHKLEYQGSSFVGDSSCEASPRAWNTPIGWKLLQQERQQQREQHHDDAHCQTEGPSTIPPDDDDDCRQTPLPSSSSPGYINVLTQTTNRLTLIWGLLEPQCVGLPPARTGPLDGFILGVDWGMSHASSMSMPDHPPGEN